MPVRKTLEELDNLPPHGDSEGHRARLLKEHPQFSFWIKNSEDREVFKQILREAIQEEFAARK